MPHAAEEEMRKLQEELKQKEERILFLSTKVDKNKMADAEMAAEIESLQAGEERRGSNASQTGDCCVEALRQQIVALAANRVEAMFQRYRGMGAAQGQIQKQNKASQQLALSASSGCNEGTPASCLELDLLWAGCTW